jgi:hypothetical protein
MTGTAAPPRTMQAYSIVPLGATGHAYNDCWLLRDLA